MSSKIKIGAISFSGVHEVAVRKSILSYVQTGEIKLPGRIRLLSRNNTEYSKIVETYKAFNEGDKVTVQLAYDGRYHDEFVGFVRRVDQAMPVRIELEGYSYQLKNKFIKNKFWKKTTVKEILEEIVQGTDITVEVGVDIPVVNYLVTNATAAEVLNSILKDIGQGAITAFFKEPTKLWVGLRYTSYQNTVKYRLGYNVIDDTSLVKRIRDKSAARFQLIYKSNAGERVRNKYNKSVGEVKKINARFVNDADVLAKIADEKAAKQNYDGLEGEIKTFLEPYIVPGDKVLLSDNRYDRNGGFIGESVTTRFGVNGARRIVGIGIALD